MLDTVPYAEFPMFPRFAVPGIGSTDAMRIAKGEWDTLYDEKIGDRRPEDLSYAWKPRLGLASEPLHAWWHGLRECKALDTETPLLQPAVDSDGKSFVIRGERILLDHDGHFYTSIDRWVVEDDCPLELKHTRASNSLRSCAEDYMPQLQHQLMVTGRPQLRFSIICGNEEPVWGYVARDEDYIRRLRMQETSFWQHVAARDRPAGLEPDKPLAAAAKRIPINGYRDYDAQSLPNAAEFIELAARYRTLKPRADECENVKSELKGLVPDDAAKVLAGGVTVARDKKGSLRVTIDNE